MEIQPFGARSFSRIRQIPQNPLCRGQLFHVKRIAASASDALGKEKAFPGKRAAKLEIYEKNEIR